MIKSRTMYGLCLALVAAATSPNVMAAPNGFEENIADIDGCMLPVDEQSSDDKTKTDEFIEFTIDISDICNPDIGWMNCGEYTIDTSIVFEESFSTKCYFGKAAGEFLETLEEEEKDSTKKDGTQDNIDTLSGKIGREIVDTVDMDIMVEDTLIYEDFQPLEKRDMDSDVQPSMPASEETGMVAIACGGKSGVIIDGCRMYPAQLQRANQEDIEAYDHGEYTPDFNATVFPNPARNSETVSLKINWDLEATVQILDLNGKTVAEFDNVSESIELGRYTSGTYIVVVTTDKGQVSHKKLIIR